MKNWENSYSRKLCKFSLLEGYMWSFHCHEYPIGSKSNKRLPWSSSSCSQPPSYPRNAQGSWATSNSALFHRNSLDLPSQGKEVEYSHKCWLDFKTWMQEPLSACPRAELMLRNGFCILPTLHSSCKFQVPSSTAREGKERNEVITDGCSSEIFLDNLFRIYF